jgi:tetratricopeptide (TPR) repeat protein
LGKLQKAREDYGQAVEIAQRGKFEEVAAATAARHALLEAQFGNLVQANDGARSALAMDRSRRTLAFVGLAQSMAGNVSQAGATADELSKHFPAETIVKYVWAPAIRAEIEISRGNSDKAIELLRAASPYEFGWASRELPSYVRGQAYLKARQGKEAAVEFQRILDHRGICITSALCALSHLQLGRAHALAGDATSARTAYQDFLALWKDADPDIPILKEAKAEYAKLQ